ncbi:MAG: LEA type 2 family protein [Deltaproteobacteria bacterium]
MGKRFLIICVVGMIAISLGVGSPALGAKKEPKAAELLPVTVQLDELSNILTGKEAIIVDMVFRVANPNPFFVPMKQLEWTVGVDKTRLGTLAVPETVYLPPKGAVLVRKTYYLNAKMAPVNLLLAGAVMNLKEGAKLFGAIRKAIAEQKAEWNFEGAAYLDTKDKTKAVPFSIKWKQTPPPK